MNPDSVGHFSGEAKSAYVENLKANGVFILTDVKNFKKKLLSGHYYVFFVNLDAMDETFLEMSQTFEQLWQRDNQKCVLCDIAAYPWEGISNNALMYYADGVCIEDDVVRLFNLLRDHNVLKYAAQRNSGGKKQGERAHAQIRCPKGCAGGKRKWICYYCQKTVNYGFNNCFYCDCGEVGAGNTQWWCQDSAHGTGFGQFQEIFLRAELCKIPHCKERNILLLGETGSGKSTWINSISNYVIFNDFNSALEHPLHYLIPSSFYIETSKCDGKTIRVGESKDEVLVEGQSATRKPKSYCFMYDNVRIRLIDVPGVCDTRGPEYDNQNFDLILKELQTLTELHAICIVLPPDSSRLTIAFRYCINELLTHLHKSAADNIVFCFTKTRQTLYRAGQTLPVLQAYLEEFEKRRKVKIALTEDSMYFFDNEAFKLLCASKNGVVFSNEEKEAYKESWDFSAKQTFKFLKHVLRHKPHRIREMVSLNEARRIIVALTRPLADITENIDLNISLVKDAKKQCGMIDLSVSELGSRLHIKQVTLVAIPMDYPRTVCASSKCSEFRTLPETNVKTPHYKQTCHEHCYLKGVELEKYPDPRLKRCKAMSKDRTTCQKCGCRWDVHLHVKYLQEQREITVVDKVTESLLKEKQHDKIEKQDVLAAYDRRIATLKERYKQIMGITANFGAFLECNSIAFCNDALKDYVTFSIKLAEQRAAASEGEEKEDHLKRAESLKRYLKEYMKQVEIMKACLRSGEKTLTSDDVLRMKQKLCTTTSDDCDIASYLKILEDANERHAKREDEYFEADECILNPERQTKLSSKSCFEKTMRSVLPNIGGLVISSAKGPESASGFVNCQGALPLPQQAERVHQSHAAPPHGLQSSDDSSDPEMELQFERAAPVPNKPVPAPRRSLRDAAPSSGKTHSQFHKKV